MSESETPASHVYQYTEYDVRTSNGEHLILVCCLVIAQVTGTGPIENDAFTRVVTIPKLKLLDAIIFLRNE